MYVRTHTQHQSFSSFLSSKVWCRIHGKSVNVGQTNMLGLGRAGPPHYLPRTEPSVWDKRVWDFAESPQRLSWLLLAPRIITHKAHGKGLISELAWLTCCVWGATNWRRRPPGLLEWPQWVCL